MACPPTEPIPPAPLVVCGSDVGPARTDEEMERDIVLRGEDERGPYVLVKTSPSFSAWFAPEADYVWRFDRPVELLRFRPMEARELAAIRDAPDRVTRRPM